ncbi:branched-chain amino acid ABC transporter substrate-binding protein [Marinivivus vitaminiproducens]|uniref:branched-chain amino acid ABC transporter substrate-binding protein n=1 Tax=Marinivivus vitaminiproducens TaxID=3035935 RepID=UPI0027A70014|nr:branched-chain amino acid ABC transporter substrate-binding protein [Geminicoccaceae bacterium SCSIO 64248]
MLATTALAGVAHAVTVGPVTDDIGVIEIPEGDPIQIGGLMVLSGPDSSLGLDQSRGAEIAFADRDEMLLDHPIQYLPEDGQCSVEGGQTGATRLAANTQIVAVVGPACSSEARGGGPVLWNAGMPMAISSATAPALTAQDRPEGFQGLVRFVYNDLAAAAAAVEYVQSQGFARVATLHDGSLYAEQLVQSFQEQFKAAGGEVVASEAIAPTDTDLRPVLTRIGTGAPQILYAPIFVGASAYLVRQAGEIRSMADVPLLGSDAVLAPAFLDAAGDDAVGYRIIGIDNDPAVLGERYVEFVQKYEDEFGEPPIAGFHANGYDAASAVMAAIEKVAVTEDGTTYIGRKAFRDALMATKDMPGVSGTVSCDPHGDCSAAAFAVFEFTDSDSSSFEVGVNPKKMWP